MTVDFSTLESWAFEEAYRLLAHLKTKPNPKGYVLFETGYGPSGLPHIGTFGEVARTSSVRWAFEQISDIPTRLIAFSDDMDGLRKVPGNIPNGDMLKPHLGKPLTQIPDPFGTHKSFGEHNNAKLREFLDTFGFRYEFYSSTECYKSGMFDNALLNVLRHHQAILDIVLPTLGDERQQTYSPFLPVCPETGRVLQVPVLETHPDKGTIVYQHPTLGRTETVVSGGHCKLQWKPDWAMRWVALDVDYEMAGKDLIDSFTVGNQICTALGGTPPCQMVYEHFVDEQGRKISKSVGNGVSIEQWLRYAPAESLALFMYKKPRTAKKMFLALIPPTVEEYFDLLEKYPTQSPQERLDNPVSFIHSGTPPAPNMPISYTMLLNLVGLMHNPTAAQLLALVQRYKPDINPQDTLLQSMMAGVLNYYTDIIAPTRQPYSPTTAEQTALLDLAESLTPLTGKETPEDIQQVYYDCGKRHYAKENLKQWFGLIYKTLFGTAQGPRLGSFTQIYGVPETVALIRSAASKVAA